VAILDCYIHDFQWPGHDSHGVLVYYNCERVMIWENRSENNGGDSVQCQTGATMRRLAALAIAPRAVSKEFVTAVIGVVMP
jgi:hypothetical protein